MLPTSMESMILRALKKDIRESERSALVRTMAFCAPVNFRQAFHWFEEFAILVNDVKIRRYGHKTSTRGADYLTALVAAAVAENVNVDGDIYLLDELLAAVLQDGEWLAPKLWLFCAYLDFKRNILSWAKERDGDQTARELDRIAEVLGDPDLVSKELLDAIVSERKYGVKECRFEDGLLGTDLDLSWLVRDPSSQTHSFDQELVRYFRVDGFNLAHISLIDRKLIDVPAEVEAIAGDGWNLMAIKQPGYLFQFYLRTDGMLSITPDGTYDLGRLLERNKSSDQHKLLRLIQTTRLFDMVVPEEVVQGMPNLATPATPSEPGYRRGAELTPEFIIPRLRAVRDGMLDRSFYEDVPKGQRTIRRHDVVWFVRRLPDGYQASRQARGLAREHGIELAPNETFVREHSRGTGEPNGKVHKAKHR